MSQFQFLESYSNNHRADLPKKETMDGSEQVEPPAVQEVTTHRTPTTPTPRLPSLHGHLKRSDSNCHFDLAERRTKFNTDEDHLRTTIAEKEKENTSLTQQLCSTRNDLADAIKKNGAFQHRVQDLLGEKSKVLTQLQAAQREAAEKERAAARKIAEFEAAHRRKDDELRTTQARLRAAEEKQVTLSKLPEVRTAYPNGLRTFLTTTNTYSEAEIIAMVETLNAEIFQTAAYMAELIKDKTMGASAQERSKNVEGNQQAMETQLRQDLGEDFWQYFQKYTELRVGPLPLQFTSESTSTSTTPTPRLPSPRGHLKKSDSNLHFDLAEPRAEFNPFRKRRNTDEDHLRTTIAEKEKENASLTQQLYSTQNDLAEAIKKRGGFQHRIQDLLGEKSKVFTQLQGVEKEVAKKERVAAQRIAELEAAHRQKNDELCTAQARLRAAEQFSLSKLPEMRNAYLTGLRTFLTTTNTYSGPEIIAMVETSPSLSSSTC